MHCTSSYDIYEDIHSTFCYMFDLQAQAADLVTLKARLTASEGEVKDLQTENSGNGEHSFKTIMEINVVESYINSCFILYA